MFVKKYLVVFFTMERRFGLLLALGLFVSLQPAVECLYGSDSAVKMLSASGFASVKKEKKMALIEFFSSACGHCVSFAPEYEKAAKALKGVMDVYAMDDSSGMGEFSVKGFPTVKAVTFDGTSLVKSEDFSGPRTASSVVDFAFTQMRELVNGRLGEKTIGSSSKPGGASSGGIAEVVVVTDANFYKTLMADTDTAWFVKVYAPWCGHCKSLAPDWERLAGALKGKVKVAKIDATKETMLASKFQVQGYPTLLMFPAGKRDAGSAVKYESSRKFEDMKSYALGYYSDFKKPIQLLSEEQFQENCAKGVCIIVFLPHILDGSKEQRIKELKEYELMAKAASGVPLAFFWSQGGDQHKVEEQLNLAFGYPAVIAVNLEKGFFIVHRGDFGHESMRKFFRMQGSPDKLPQNLQTFVTVKPWNPQAKDEL